jgi:RNA recognition motif-containing protein
MKILISNLNTEVSSKDLQAVLEEFGTVRSLELLSGPLDSPYAVVEMSSSQEAVSVVEFLQGDLVNGRPLHLKLVEQWEGEDPK